MIAATAQAAAVAGIAESVVGRARSGRRAATRRLGEAPKRGPLAADGGPARMRAAVMGKGEGGGGWMARPWASFTFHTSFQRLCP
jgi:hypothetical protein